MRPNELVRLATLGGPGLCGYAYNADLYCEDCAWHIIRDLAADLAAQLDTDDLPTDTDTLPQPIFFGEHDLPQYCEGCGDYLYGGTDDVAF